MSTYDAIRLECLANVCNAARLVLSSANIYPAHGSGFVTTVDQSALDELEQAVLALDAHHARSLAR